MGQVFGGIDEELAEERDLLRPSADERGPEGLVEYRALEDATSLVGLPGMPGVP